MHCSGWPQKGNRGGGGGYAAESKTGAGFKVARRPFPGRQIQFSHPRIYCIAAILKMHGSNRSECIVCFPAGGNAFAERTEEALDPAPQGYGNPMELFASDLMCIANGLIDDLRVNGSIMCHNHFLSVSTLAERTMTFSVALQNNIFSLINNPRIFKCLMNFGNQWSRHGSKQ
jgi:hypothetical protein